ncbi:MAG: TIGR02597 family protein [Chthoniobacterales bacterium]
MQTSSKTLITALVTLAAAATLVHAQNATTDPVGAFTYSPLGLSDTMISLPLHRSPVFQGQVASVSGGNVTISGTPAWTTGQFVYAPGTQPNTYYALIATGALEGRHFKIASNTLNTLSLELGSDSIASLQPNDLVTIVPYWTFGTVWPNGAGVSGTSSHGTRPTEILLYSGTNTGINFAPSQTFYYFTGTSPGWRRIGGGGTTVRNDDVIPVGAFIVYRQNTNVSNTFALTGSVQMAANALKLGTKLSGVRQDNQIAFAVSSPMTLSQSNLFQGGAFEGSASHGTRADELLVFNNAEIKKNKSPQFTYYYFTGASPGWRRIGGGGTTVRDTDVVFEPGSAYVIRKKAAPTPSVVVATTLPPYLQ